MLKPAKLKPRDLDGCVGSALLERAGIEVAVRRAAAEVARADLPGEVAAWLEVIRAQTALTGVLVEAAELRAGVERQHGVLGERTEAHGRGIEHRGRIGLLALGPAHLDPGVRLGQEVGRERVVDPLVARRVDIPLRPEGHRVAHALGSLVDHRAHLPAQRPPVRLPLDEVLVQLG